MSGIMRLSVFLSVLWMLGVLLLTTIDPGKGVAGPVLLLGVLPLSLAWGLWWVVRGFRTK